MAPKGYQMVHITVTDPINHRKNVTADAAAFAKYEARFLVRGGGYKAVEGPAPKRYVEIEFESCRAALACCRSAADAQSEVLIVEGANLYRRLRRHRLGDTSIMCCHER
jgi:uncharacterized protein (DUF1330 family)